MNIRKYEKLCWMPLGLYVGVSVYFRKQMVEGWEEQEYEMTVLYGGMKMMH